MPEQNSLAVCITKIKLYVHIGEVMLEKGGGKSAKCLSKIP